MHGFGAKIILDHGRTMTEFRRSNSGQARRDSGWRIMCKSYKHKIKSNKFTLNEKAKIAENLFTNILI